MSEKQSAAVKIIRREYEKIFITNWSLLTGGVLIGLMSIITFAWSRPWGVAGGIRNWGDWFFYWAGLYEKAPVSAFFSSKSLLAIGLLWGALAAALIAKQFSFRLPPLLELIKGIAGGIFLGVGAALAGGCNVGGFYSSISAFSLSGFAMLVGLMSGAWVGLKYLYWELEHLPSGGSGINFSFNENSGLLNWQPYIGFALLLGAYLLKEYYSIQGYIIPGGLLLCGIVFGFIMHRSRFCFARCFREPFMTGDSSATKAVIISLLIGVSGFAVIKWAGFRSEYAMTASSFGLGGVVGGFIFGFGMLMTGGCGSGTIWRVAEGQVKLMVALVFFALSTSLAKTWIKASPGLKTFVGSKVFLPDYFGYPMTMFAVFMIMAAWYLAVVWNEESEYFVIQI